MNADQVRLFIAIELPAEVRRALAALQERLSRLDGRRVVRWTAPDSIHLTLKFIGETGSEQVKAISAALDSACTAHPPFNLSIQGMGGFPNTRQPRIVWAGLTGDVNTLAALRDTVEVHVAPLGFPTEGRPFSPHLTIGRIKDAPTTHIKAFGALLSEEEVGNLSQWRVESVALMNSDLRPSGAVYTRLAETRLKAVSDRR
ncbi:MAG TPA: RNA 2',3'-cyclic phosphodiesterase [Aggregatilineales bacterium]|nr:RNA 2',3'-cyclic phosphodiesterase [Aggregatilineales bacterium]